MIINAPRTEQLPALRSLWQQAFGDTDTFLDAFFSTAYAPDHCRAITAGTQVHAALYWLDCTCGTRRYAYLYAIATDAALRGRGLCHRLMDDTHRHLRAQGYAGALLVPATPTLFALYRSMGYTAELPCHTFTCDAAPSPISLYRIHAAEYTRRRAALLPDTALAWSRQSMAFLEATHTLYAGDSFLAAVRREGDTLVGAELLGDLAAAPQLVRALSCRTGRFRTVGTDTPLALYHPFSPTPAPTHLGFAFD